MMQEPFPVLKYLGICTRDGSVPVLPAKFLGGSAPRLQEIILSRIPFPALPTLLLSTSDLVSLGLYNIPPSGQISPGAMVVGLAALPRLKTLDFGFQSATPRPDRSDHAPPVTRTDLPALDHFQFQGASEYLDGFVAQIDAPQLDRIEIRYLNQLVDFQVTQLYKFINRSVGPKLTLFRYAQITFYGNAVSFKTSHHANDSYAPPARITVIC